MSRVFFSSSLLNGYDELKTLSYAIPLICSIGADVRHAQEQRSNRTLIVADEVINGLKQEALRMGEGTTHSARVSAWGLLGKHLGMFIDRKVIETPVDNRPVEELSDAELMAIIMDGNAKSGNVDPFDDTPN